MTNSGLMHLDPGAPALHHCGFIEMAVRLISEGAEVNAKNSAGETPLHHALIKNHLALAEILRKHGALE